MRAATNCDEVELLLNKKSLGKKAVSAGLYFGDWTVGFQPGELTAIGYRKGKKVATSTLVTVSPATKLQLSPLPSSVTSDVTVYEVTVRDKADRVVVDATPEVTVKVEGGGQLIGIDSGELEYIGAFKTDTRKAYQGRLLVTVKKTGAASELRVTASAPGLLLTTSTDKQRP